MGQSSMDSVLQPEDIRSKTAKERAIDCKVL